VHYKQSHRLSRNSTPSTSYLRIKRSLLVYQLLTCSPISTNPPPPWQKSPQCARTSSLPRLHDRTQTIFGRTPLDEWSARSKDLYITIRNTMNRQTVMLQAGFEPAIPASEWSRTPALGHPVAAIGTSPLRNLNVRPAVRHPELSVATVNTKWNNYLNFMKQKYCFLQFLYVVSNSLTSVIHSCVVCSTNWERTGRGLSIQCNKIYPRIWTTAWNVLRKYIPVTKARHTKKHIK
jgi:hypothetical protein